MAYKIGLEKEIFKFSCSHFTILGADRAEHLHGHNYYVSIFIGVKELDPALGIAFDFNAVKPLVRKITEDWDEFVLIPLCSPYLKIGHDLESVTVIFGPKKYVFPIDDVKMIPAVNITTEELSRIICEKLLVQLRLIPEIAVRATSLSVQVQETRGQSVQFQSSF